MNLVSNASEAISDEGEVIIRTKNCYIDKPIGGYDDVREGDYVVLTVSDNGRGISASDIKKIFEPFYTKKVMGRSGTGLGLAVVWGTVKDHDGYIDVQSEDGRGSTFTIYLPATREELTGDEQKTSPEHYMGKGETILVVDDVKEQREVAGSMLTRLGYRVEAVSSGEEAVAYLKFAEGRSHCAGHDHGPRDGRTGDVPADTRHQPEAEGNNSERFFGDGACKEGPGARGGRLCQETVHT